VTIRIEPGTQPGTVPRNGLLIKPYVYRGTGVDTLTAFMDDEPGETRRPGRPREYPCGTPAAYRRHLRYGEKPCGECRRAHTQSSTERRQAARKQAAA
jgi:hypothetical protein